MTTMAEHVRAPRRRANLIKDDRLSTVDMRTRQGRRFSVVLAAVRAEFGDADPIRLAEVARLRMIAEGAQRDALAGKLPLDRLVRISNLVVRSERQLTAVSRGKPSHAGPDLHAYLAEIAEIEACDEPVETDDLEVESEITERPAFESEVATEHAAGAADIALAEAAVEGVEQ